MNRPEEFSLSLVVPAFNEADCVGKLVEELSRIVPPLTKHYEILFIDDGSKDATFARVAELSARNPHVHGISLSRNCGHMAALACGLEAARGDVVITIDADMQHPPELIPAMIAAWRQGYDVVNTQRRNLKSSGAEGALLSKLFYRIYNRVSDVKIVPDCPDFRLLDRRCVDALTSMTERLKFFRGMVPYIGFRQTTIAFDCPPRFAGTRGYTFAKSLRLAYDGLLSFSDVGLLIPFILGLVITGVALLYLVVAAVLVLCGVTALRQGWMSIISFNVLTLGLNMTFIGVFGLYISKIFNEVKHRPLYFIRETVGQPLLSADSPAGHGPRSSS